MHTQLIRTPFGWVGAAARDGAMLAVTLPAEDQTAARAALAAACGAGARPVPSTPLLDRFASDLARYLAGGAVDFSAYPVDLSRLMPFHQAALRALRRIPAGEVRTYTWIAQQAGRPTAARAAGQAMHANPLPLLLPCHRVVGSNGSLTGFGGGLALKRTLLTLEGIRLRGTRVVLSTQPSLGPEP